MHSIGNILATNLNSVNGIFYCRSVETWPTFYETKWQWAMGGRS